MESEEGLQDSDFLERRQANIPGVLLSTATPFSPNHVHHFVELSWDFFFLLRENSMEN